MAALLDFDIREQPWETILTQIGGIIKVELENQKTRLGLLDDINVYNSRISSFDISESLMINVSVDSTANDNFGNNSAQGDTTYNIDVHCRSSGDQLNPGDTVSSMRLNRYVSIIEYIFISSYYRNLGLDPGFIRNRYLRNIQFFDGDKNDATYVKVARLTLSVTVLKCTEMYQGKLLVGTDAEVKLDSTDLGYRYEYNND